jgi:hypothetical protein
MALVVEHLPNKKHKALSSTPSTAKKFFNYSIED